MNGQAAAVVAAAAVVLVLLALWRPGTVGGVRGRSGDVGSAPRRGASSPGAPDPVPDDVAAEALGQAVALLQAGVSATDLFRVWASTRADALEGTGTAPGSWLGEDGEPSALTRTGRRRVREASARRAWARALTAAHLNTLSGGDPTTVDGPGRAWRETMWAVGLATGTGAPLADLLERVRDECTARTDAARARTAGLAAARTTRRILMGLPAGGLLLAQALGAQPLQILVDTAWGRAALIAGLTFWAVAALWSRRVMRAGAPT
jgi:hypothetical protein